MLVRDLVGQTKSQFWYFKILWCLHLSRLMLHWCFPCNLLWVILKSIWRHHHHLQLCSKGALWVSTFATTLGCWPQTVDRNISSKWNESWRCGSRWQQWGWDDLAAAGWGVEEQPGDYMKIETVFEFTWWVCFSQSQVEVWCLCFLMVYGA